MKKKLNISLKRDELILKEIEKNLKRYKKYYFKYKVNLSKIKYIKMIKNRYISCLLNISNKDLKEGVIEIKKKYKDKIRFNDVLTCIIYKN